MSLIQDVAGRLVQSFLSLDDLVLGQGVIAEGGSQVGLTGRSVAGSLVAGSNVAARAVHAGIQLGTKTAKMTAEALEGFVPGAGLAKTLATHLDDEVAEAAEHASQLASHALELTGGEMPRNPLTKEKWLGKSAPRGYSWGELAADTVVGSLGRFARAPVSLGVESMMRLASTDPGRRAVEAALNGVGMLLEQIPGSSSTELDTTELREALLAVTTSSGNAAVSNVLDLAEAAARLALGDTRRLKEAVEQAVTQAELIASHGELDELGELMPEIPLSGTLKERARSLVDHAPKRFLRALERGPNGEAPSAGQVLSGIMDDADNLLVFATEYPLVLALMGANTGAMLNAALLDVTDIEAYLKDDGLDDTPQPWSAAQIEDYVGKAPAGAFFESTVHAAQDTAFIYSSEVLGRDEALARAERLYDGKVRDRLARDVSLDLDILRARRGKVRDGKIRDQIAATTDEAALTRQCRTCQEQLDSLAAFTRSLFGYQPKNVAERTEILRTFLSLANQDLALRGAAPAARDETREARQRFESWLDSAGA